MIPYEEKLNNRKLNDSYAVIEKEKKKFFACTN